ncbi:MAG: hypothetical protein A2Y56_11885 [Candidatus Aminicenantes bacterium RBG_13_63_10]|nr:MAG: hypothetical protein A2Y56_11885 [Candidatus Aminicenantes bacterium RBG_13_63_10]
MLAVAGCRPASEKEKSVTFQDDLDFLKRHKPVIVLSDDSGLMQAALVADWQGRVVTSTADGERGLSFGWINRGLISSGERQEHINVFGGEDRFWLGPEGGQYSIFFSPGSPFDLEHWFVPPAIDWEPFRTVSLEKSRAVFQRDMILRNYSSTEFRLEVLRKIRLLGRQDIGVLLGAEVPAGLKLAAFESVNSIKNTGSEEWRKETGLLSVWILGMFNPSPKTVVVIPFRKGNESDLGPVVNDSYFGKVPEDRLAVGDGALFFSGDGAHRSKIGLSPLRARPVLGSYDGQNGVLTLVQYTFIEGAVDYVNSMWELQEEPYRGDVVNSYNDGPPAPGAKPLGPFYELETSSPAAALEPGETLTHIHRTIHLQGPGRKLDRVAQAVLGVSLDEINKALK